MGVIGRDGNGQGCTRSPKQASPPGSDDDDPILSLTRCSACQPAWLAGTTDEKAEGEMKPTRPGAETMPACHAMPVRIDVRVCTDTQTAPAFALFCFACFVSQPGGNNRLSPGNGAHFPFEHVHAVLPYRAYVPVAVRRPLVSRFVHFLPAHPRGNLQRRRRDCNACLAATLADAATVCDCRAARHASW